MEKGFDIGRDGVFDSWWPYACNLLKPEVCCYSYGGIHLGLGGRRKGSVDPFGCMLSIHVLYYAYTIGRTVAKKSVPVIPDTAPLMHSSATVAMPRLLP